MIGLPEKPKQLTDPSWHDLQLAYRYRATTLLVHQELSSDTRDAIEDRLARLTVQQWLIRTPLPGPKWCYALGPKGQRLFEVHQHVGFPFAQAPLARHLGMTLFCAAAGFERLLPEEFHERFPDCHRPGLPGDSYLQDRQHPEQVAWCLVDGGSQPFRLHAKVARLLNARRQLLGFKQLVSLGRFQVILLCATEKKAARIRAVFADQPELWAPHSVVVVPDLLQFLF